MIIQQYMHCAPASMEQKHSSSVLGSYSCVHMLFSGVAVVLSAAAFLLLALLLLMSVIRDCCLCYSLDVTQLKFALGLLLKNVACHSAAPHLALVALFSHPNAGGLNLVNPPGNQGKCGSCVAFAVSGAAETAVAARLGRNVSSINRLSNRFLFYCTEVSTPNHRIHALL
jgi:C1A family cysteine protease